MKQVAELIKYEGDNTTFVWKHPTEDFNSFTQLIVHESQEALFMMNGKALDLFGPGRHTLETQKVPLLSRIFKRIAGKESPFHCEVYFINKVEQMAIKWGTDSYIQFIEPTYKFPLAIGANGEMALRVEDSRKLLVKLVGTEVELNASTLVKYFRSIMMTKVKTYIAQTIKANKIDIFEIDEYLDMMSGQIKDLLTPVFADYGLALERFNINAIAKPDGNPNYEKYKNLFFAKHYEVEQAKLRQNTQLIDAETEAKKTILASQALATKRAQEGYTYQQERGFDVAGQMAQNEATGQFTNLGIGLGTMAGVGGTMAGIIGNSMASATENAPNMNFAGGQGQSAPQTIKCADCGADIPANAKFCPSCGAKVVHLEEGQMICPHCGMTVPKGKFCPECGQKLIATCPKCGAEVGSSKFCPECGEKL